MKLIAFLRSIFGTKKAAPPQPAVQMVDPKTLLFSIPTLSDDLPALEPISGSPSSTEFCVHEDEWSQVEFFPRPKLQEVQRLLKELKAFENAHRTQSGWRKVYVRKVSREPIVSGPNPVAQLENILGVTAGPAPILTSSDTASGGKVSRGFTMPLGGNITLYGYSDDAGIPVLAAVVDANPDDLKLTQAFTKLNAHSGVLLVDWRAQLVLVRVAPSGQIEVWRP